MKEFIAYIIKNLVDQPNAVEVNCFEKDNQLIVEIRVGSGDMGKVVGRKGVTINAIRTIAATVCARLGSRVRIELIE